MPLDQLEAYEKSIVDKANGRTSEVDDDGASLDEILGELEDDTDFMEKYREQRLQQIADDMRKMKHNVESEQYGQVFTMTDESELMRLTSATDQVVIHFYLDSFQKCATMDAKLKKLAEKHIMTRFFRISVEKCPFLVTKLQIKVLPCVVAYKNGLERDKIVGFTRLGNQTDDFEAGTLETILFNCGVLARKIQPRGIRTGRTDESDSDLDL
ncbi:Plp1p [Lachancea thermotolerans CBS 6340]|uniref:KLTH0F08756p n=1 Tax=Lachancea thermotolerans (strain ATCC 56472 / CBS 6340 / NRRL Y-8284) TaxID=559295 RepID=C5DKZ6_LACTC|nr:KLTH0F08756p [Lachancea thermotolerans CBS 6340]CAR24147.1 KLTH0F08756p [Lachancea thermotolerans CBS 6340]